MITWRTARLCCKRLLASFRSRLSVNARRLRAESFGSLNTSHQRSSIDSVVAWLGAVLAGLDHSDICCGSGFWKSGPTLQALRLMASKALWISREQTRSHR
ncbi:hypothetical protein D3C81_1858500 [compost metagenome]